MAGNKHNVSRFNRLNLHDEKHSKSDNQKHPFVGTAKTAEEHRKTLYGCAFNQYIKWPNPQTCAAVGGPHIYVYVMDPKVYGIQKIWTGNLSKYKTSKGEKKTEDLYTITWCYDTFEEKNKRNPHKIVTGGEAGQIYVIDAISKKLDNTLISCGNSVNDLRTCPTNSNLFAAASKDMTIRVFHIRNSTSLLTLSSLEAHVQADIQSVDWTPDSQYIYSSAFDHLAVKWDLRAEDVQLHLQEACQKLNKSVRNSLSRNNRDMPRNNAYGRTMQMLNGPFSKVITMPAATTNDIHHDAIDCLRHIQFKNGDYVITKACGRESYIRMWRFGAPMGEMENTPFGAINGAPNGVGKVQKTQTCILSKKLPHGESWFVKFAVDPRKRWLSCGGKDGNVHIFDLMNMEEKAEYEIWTSWHQIRMTAFCTDGNIMMAVGENGIVARFDRVPANVTNGVSSTFWRN